MVFHHKTVMQVLQVQSYCHFVVIVVCIEEVTVPVDGF